MDLRALALFRIGLGLALLVDLSNRSQHMFLFYSDSGVLSRAALLEKIAPPWSINLLLLNGQWWYVATYFFVAALAALAVMAGWRTKSSLFLMWLLTIGLYDRNPATNQAGDYLLLLLQFWGLFLPIQARWSIDAALVEDPIKDEESETNYSSLGTAAYLAQLTLLYVMSGVLKTGEPWKDGTAVFYALSLDALVSGFGSWLRGFSGFTTTATFGIVYCELVAPLFFFMPWQRGLSRSIIVCVLSLIHVGFGLCLHIGVFVLTDLVALLPLLPTSFFRKARDVLISSRAAETTIIVDRMGSAIGLKARLLRELLLPDAVTIRETAAGAEGATAAPSSRSWFVRDSSGNVLEYPESVSGLLRLSMLTRWLLPISNPRLLSAATSILNSLLLAPCVSLARKNSVIIAGFIPQMWRQILRNGLLLYSLGFILVANIESTDNYKFHLPTWALLPGKLLHLNQKWSMFHGPPTSNSWIVVAGTLSDGTPVNVLTGATGPIDFSWTPTGEFSDRSLRWRIFLEWLRKKEWDKGAAYRDFFGRYLCRRWNQNNPDDTRTLRTFRFLHVSEAILLSGGRGAQIRTTMSNHHCSRNQAQSKPKVPPRVNH